MSGMLRRTTMRISLIAALVLVTFAGAARADVLKEGDKLKDFDVAVDANGKSFKLKSLGSKWVLVTIGAQWCVPCAKELPAWDELAGKFKDKVVFVALDADNNVADGKAFHDQLKLKNMIRVYMPQDKSGVVGAYGSDTMPSTFIFDPKGIVKFVRKGFEKGDVAGEKQKLTDALNKLLTP
jgi:thiol-disulfide isomerase/thioredoxin